MWPALGSLEHLHPEYEALHFNGRKYYLDIALVHWPLMVNFEADDFSSHLTGMDRGKFCSEKRRDMQLQLAGWRIVRIPYDDIMDQPVQWRQAVKELIRLWSGEIRSTEALSVRERDIESVVRMRGRVSVGEVCERLDICERTARHYLKQLQRKGVIVPDIAGRERVHYYKLNQSRRLSL